MALSIGTLKLELQLTTTSGGPIILGGGTIDVPVHAASTRHGATLTIDQDVLRHELACALMDAARQIEAEATDPE